MGSDRRGAQLNAQRGPKTETFRARDCCRKAAGKLVRALSRRKLLGYVCLGKLFAFDNRSSATGRRSALMCLGRGVWLCALVLVCKWTTTTTKEEDARGRRTPGRADWLAMRCSTGSKRELRESSQGGRQLRDRDIRSAWEYGAPDTAVCECVGGMVPGFERERRRRGRSFRCPELSLLESVGGRRI